MTAILSFFDDKQEFCYTVEDGESLTSIAFKFSVPVSNIIALNKLKADVSAGQILYISRGDYFVVTPENFSTEYVQNLAKENGKDILFPFDILKK